MPSWIIPVAVILAVLAVIASRKSSSISIKGIILGVLRWDMHDDTGVTPQEQGFLKDWHKRWPFYAKLENGRLTFRRYDMARRMQLEINYAQKAGIDYWIFNGPARTLVPNGFGLHKSLYAYLRNKSNHKVNFVQALFAGENARAKGIVNCRRDHTEKQMKEILQRMKNARWQHVTIKGGRRPLFVVLKPELYIGRMGMKNLVEYIRWACEREGLGNPYIVAQSIENTARYAKALKQAGFDAINDYGPTDGAGTHPRDKAMSYKGATAALKARLKRDSKLGIDLVPYGSLNWYPWPRSGGKQAYHHHQNPKNKKEVVERVKMIAQIAADTPAKTMMLYSWNENSEGVGVVPKLGNDGQAVTFYLDSIKEAV